MEIIAYIIGGLILFGIALALLQLLAGVIGCTLLFGFISWLVWDSFSIGAIIGAIIGLIALFFQLTKKIRCMTCDSLSTTEVRPTQELLDSISFKDYEYRPQLWEVESIRLCDKCGRYSVWLKAKK